MSRGGHSWHLNTVHSAGSGVFFPMRPRAHRAGTDQCVRRLPSSAMATDGFVGQINFPVMWRHCHLTYAADAWTYILIVRPPRPCHAMVKALHEVGRIAYCLVGTTRYVLYGTSAYATNAIPHHEKTRMRLPVAKPCAENSSAKMRERQDYSSISQIYGIWIRPVDGVLTTQTHRNTCAWEMS